MMGRGGLSPEVMINVVEILCVSRRGAAAKMLGPNGRPQLLSSARRSTEMSF